MTVERPPSAKRALAAAPTREGSSPPPPSPLSLSPKVRHSERSSMMCASTTRPQFCFLLGVWWGFCVSARAGEREERERESLLLLLPHPADDVARRVVLDKVDAAAVRAHALAARPERLHPCGVRRSPLRALDGRRRERRGEGGEGCPQFEASNGLDPRALLSGRRRRERLRVFVFVRGSGFVCGFAEGKKLERVVRF